MKRPDTTHMRRVARLAQENVEQIGKDDPDLLCTMVRDLAADVLLLVDALEATDPAV